MALTIKKGKQKKVETAWERTMTLIGSGTTPGCHVGDIINPLFVTGAD